jgi:intracellular sulfur oxidation DsrE/DsrF family protein
VVKRSLFLIVLVFSFTAVLFGQSWPAPKAPAIPEADGYVVIPSAVFAPTPKTAYSVVFDGTKAAAKPDSLLPVVNAAGGVLNDLVVGNVPFRNRRLAIIFHGPAVDGILDNAHYHAKYGIDNPNLKVLSALKKQGVVLLVCGQHLATEHIDPKILSPDITVASDAYLVLIELQNRGYALMLF